MKPQRTIKRRGTRSDISPERWQARYFIADLHKKGRTRLSVSEIAHIAMGNLMQTKPERIGPMAMAAMRHIVRTELGRRISGDANIPEWLSIPVSGQRAKEYVHISKAGDETIASTIQERKELVDHIKARIKQLDLIATEMQVKDVTAEEAILALWPDTEEEEVDAYIDALAVVGAARGY